MKWKMPYNAGFAKWVTTTFSLDSKNNTLFQHQQFVKEFMQEESPYHGLLLYHGLGVGKTRSAIEIAKSNDRDIIVMLPASLRKNFLGEIQKVADSKGASFSFMSYNGINRKNINQYVEENFFDNKLVIIDEVHNFISGATGSGIIYKQLYQTLMNAKNIKIVALSGTPLINKPIEIGALLNLLNGYIYSTVFKYTGYTDFTNLEAKLLQVASVSSCFIDTQTNLINISFLQDGFVKDDEGNVYRSKSAAPSKKVKDIILASGLKIKSEKETKSLLLPLKEEDFEEYFIDYDTGEIKNEILFSRRAGGLVSYFESYNPEDYPEQKPLQIVEVPMSKTHFGTYLKVRQEEIDKESKALKFKKTQRIDVVSKKDEIKNGNVYRSFSRGLCNYAFPASIKRPYPSTLKYETDDAYLINEDGEAEGGGAVNWKEKKKIYEKKLGETLDKLQEHAGEFLSYAGLEEHGPKMLAIIKNIEKCLGPVLVYSSFRNVEGLGIFGMALHENLGYEELTVKKVKGEWMLQCKDFLAPKFIVFSDKREETTILLDIYNSDFDKLPDSVMGQIKTEWIDKKTEKNKKNIVDNNLHGEFVKILMITQSGAEGISLKNVRQVHEMEPHWNNIRSKQVRGRAIRAMSHIALPKKERSVETFLYITVLNEEQKSHSLFKAHDDGLTSDGYVYSIAKRKEVINNKLLELVQGCAVDCVINKKAHKNKVSCFKPPHANNFVYYVGDISHDVVDKHIVKNIKTKKEYKKLGLEHNGIELLYLTNPSEKERQKYMDVLNIECGGGGSPCPPVHGVFYVNDMKKLVGVMKFKPDGKGAGFKWIIKPDTLKKLE